MSTEDAYIVRVYRRDARSRRLTGVVESASGSLSTAFHSIEDLWQVLGCDPAPRSEPSTSQPETPPEEP